MKYTPLGPKNEWIKTCFAKASTWIWPVNHGLKWVKWLIHHPKWGVHTTESRKLADLPNILNSPKFGCKSFHLLRGWFLPGKSELETLAGRSTIYGMVSSGCAVPMIISSRGDISTYRGITMAPIWRPPFSPCRASCFIHGWEFHCSLLGRPSGTPSVGRGEPAAFPTFSQRWKRHWRWQHSRAKSVR